MQVRLFSYVCALGCAQFLAFSSLRAELPAQVRGVIHSSCLDCHEGSAAEAGLDLSTLPADVTTHASEWARVVDRVQAGEMPPPEHAELRPEVKRAFLEQTSQWLSNSQQDDFLQNGRVRARRLTNLQLERSLQDLLGIDIPLKREMPEEQRTAGFTTVADGQPMSHFHLEQHLNVVDLALDEAYRRALTKADEWEKDFPAEQVARSNPRRRCREPEMLDGLAVTWSSRLIFYGRLPVTTAREDGWYRFTVRAKSLNTPRDKGVWCTVKTGHCVSSAPILEWVDAFELTDELQDFTFDAWLDKGKMLEIRAGDVNLKTANFAGGQVGAGEGEPQNVPGIAIASLKMSRIHKGPDDAKIRRNLFGNLQPKWSKATKSMVIESESPREDAVRLMQSFASLAFRRPVSAEVTAPYTQLVFEKLAAGEDFQKSLRAGYRAILCSPRFMFLQEDPGKLDSYAIASRLSYFLWSSTPDEQLLELAANDRLQNPKVINQQVERMLNSPRGEEFVKDFAYQWLELNLIDFTLPDRKLYPGFDMIVERSMLAETHQFLQTMLDENLSVDHIIDADFTFLNSHLARYYGIDRVEGTELQKVSLTPDDHHGGLITHGSVMKVTANGTSTSPVIRGVWISERLLGVDIPPPPKSVPAIEPDIRGAKTVRDQLALHKSDPACATCHVKIDPPGFALENFDPSGRWRDKYVQYVKGKKSRGHKVDPSFEMPSGEPFSSLQEFQSIVLNNREQLARNVANHLITYGTGAPVAFADRAAVEKIVKDAKADDYGFRSLLHGVATSPVFLSK